MRTIKHTQQFKKDWRRETSGRSAEYIDKLTADLAAVTKVLRADVAPAQQYRDHPLSGKWKHHRDCHVRNDLVLIYCKPDPDTLALVRLG
jgi:mRNA interferase YafQ